MSTAIQNKTARKVRLIIVGDEILSGRRQDKHFSKLIELLSQRGMQLSSAEFVSDERDAIAATLVRSFSSDDIVFSCGGIGATPDDQTRQAAAQALCVALALHPEAERSLTVRCTQNQRRGRGIANR